MLCIERMAAINSPVTKPEPNLMINRYITNLDVSSQLDATRSLKTMHDAIIDNSKNKTVYDRSIYKR